MKPDGPDENAEPLRRALRQWAVDASLPPRFQEQVWQRIARREARKTASPWAFLSAWVQNALSQPSLAASYIVLLLLAGLSAGYWQAQQEQSRLTEAARASYTQMVDPYRTPR